MSITCEAVPSGFKLSVPVQYLAWSPVQETLVQSK